MEDLNQNTQPEVELAVSTPEDIIKIEVPIEAPVKKNKFWTFFQNNFLALSILTAGVMISGSVLYSNAHLKAGAANIGPDAAGAPIVKKDVSVDDDPSLGAKNAKVTMIEFSDFQCPYCRTWWKASFEQLKTEYINTGKVRFVYRDYPLPFHPMSVPSAQASECADEQGKYWEMNDKIFGEEDKDGQGTVTYSVNDIKRWASEIGLNAAQFNQCLDSGKYKAEVEKDSADGSAAGVSGTPSFFINGRLVVGSQPYATFKAIIDEELKK